ncbi:MAG: 50S ribosomal protein L29 [Candidatus Anstonellales archaeon]
MAVVKAWELRQMGKEELLKKMEEYGRELMLTEANPGKIRELKKAIARIKTELRERELGIIRKKGPKRKAEEKPKENSAQ